MSKPHGELFRRMLQLLVVALSTVALPIAAAQARTVAVFVDGPGAAAMRAAVVRAAPSGIEVVEGWMFRAELTRAGQKAPLGSYTKQELRRIRLAAKAVDAEAVLLVRVRQDKKSRSVRFQVVDLLGDGPPPESVRLGPRASDKDSDDIAAAVARALDAYKPPPAETAPEPEPEAPPPSPVIEAPPVARPAPPPAELPPAEVSKTPAQVLATSVIDLAVSGALVGRHFEYDNGISPEPYLYRLRAAPAVRASGNLFPFATTRSVFADLGIQFDYSRMFMQRADFGGAPSSSAPTTHALGLRVRIHPGLASGSPRVLLGISVGYAFSFFGAVGPGFAELPEVRYRAIRPAFDARIFLGRFSILGGAAFRAIVDGDAISTRFYGPKAYGLDAELGAAFSISRHLEARVIGSYERYAADFAAPSGTNSRSGGAVDQWYGARAGLALIF